MAVNEKLAEFFEKHIGSLRLLAFREDDRNNRRLIFDSDYVSCDRAPDSALLAEIIFGSTPIMCSGESVKIHQFKLPSKIMFTKVFPAHLSNASSSSLCTLSGIKYSRELSNTLRRFSVDSENILPHTEEINKKTLKISKSAKEQKSVAASPISSCRSSDSSDGNEILMSLQRLRRSRIGIAVLFTLGGEAQSDDDAKIRRRIKFLCLHAQAIFSAMKEHLQDAMLAACHSHGNVTALMHSHYQNFLHSMKCLFDSACRAHNMLRYFRISTSHVSLNESLVDQFIQVLSTLAGRYDNKQTNFFLSTLVTALLEMSRESAIADNPSFNVVTDMRLYGNDNEVLKSLIVILGYFLQFSVSELDRVLISPMKWSSLLFPEAKLGALTSLWDRVRGRRSSQQNASNAKNGNFNSSMEYPPALSPESRRNSAAYARTKRSQSYTNGLDSVVNPVNVSPIIISVLAEDDSEKEDNAIIASDESAKNNNCPSPSSSASNVSGSPNFCGNTSDDETVDTIFDQAEEMELNIEIDYESSSTSSYSASLCEKLDIYHDFNELNEKCMSVSIGRSCENAVTSESLVIDAVSWKVYRVCSESLTQNAVSNWRVCLPSALVTELLENVQALHNNQFDASICLTYLEDGVKSLFQKSSALATVLKSDHNNELCSNICAALQCDASSLAFLVTK